MDTHYIVLGNVNSDDHLDMVIGNYVKVTIIRIALGTMVKIYNLLLCRNDSKESGTLFTHGWFQLA
jgi:hypothetical protein